ncbi:hypothetical protein SMG44B_50198 [Stenotrophomonas maltophilia]
MNCTCFQRRMSAEEELLDLAHRLCASAPRFSAAWVLVLANSAQCWHRPFWKHWYIWTRRPPPKGKVARSNRAGVTICYSRMATARRTAAAGSPPQTAQQRRRAGHDANPRGRGCRSRIRSVAKTPASEGGVTGSPPRPLNEGIPETGLGWVPRHTGRDGGASGIYCLWQIPNAAAQRVGLAQMTHHECHEPPASPRPAVALRHRGQLA